MNIPEKIPYMTACEARWYISYRAGDCLDEVASAGQAVAQFIAETTHETIRFEKVTLRYQCVNDYEEFTDYLANPFEYDASIGEIVAESETGGALTEALTELKETCADGIPVLQYLRTDVASTKIKLANEALWISKDSPEFELYRFDEFQSEQAVEDPLTLELQLRPAANSVRNLNEYELTLHTATDVWWRESYGQENHERLRAILSKLATDDRVVSTRVMTQQFDENRLLEMLPS
jgi:hypothetical protein